MDASDEIRELRRCIRDLAAINALPLLWVGQSAREVVNGFLDALLTALRLDFAYGRISDPEGGPIIEASRVSGDNPGSTPEDIGRALAPMLGSMTLADVPNPFGSGTIRIAVTPIDSATWAWSKPRSTRYEIARSVNSDARHCWQAESSARSPWTLR